MKQLILLMEDKKEIILDELKMRPCDLTDESITEFVARTLDKYHYSKGAERYFWIAIKKLEEEGKLIRLRMGKKKLLFIRNNSAAPTHQLSVALGEQDKAKRIEVIKAMVTSCKLHGFT